MIATVMNLPASDGDIFNVSASPMVLKVSLLVPCVVRPVQTELPRPTNCASDEVSVTLLRTAPTKLLSVAATFPVACFAPEQPTRPTPATNKAIARRLPAIYHLSPTASHLP